MTDDSPSWRRRHRTAWRCLCVSLVLVLAGLGGVAALQQYLVGHLHRVDGAFSGLHDRPSRGGSGDALNFLVVLTDDRSRAVMADASPGPSWLPRAGHADSLLLLHLDADRRSATAIALPLDLAVHIPGHPSEQRLGDVFAHRPSVTVRTVESLTGVRIDHLVAFDWSGLSRLTDQTHGGVVVDVPADVRDPDLDRRWDAGRYTLSGADAVAYASQRKGLPDPVLGQTLRTLYLLRKLGDGALHTSMRHNPLLLLQVLDTASKHLSVESGWSSGQMRGLAISLRNLRSAAISYAVVPVQRDQAGAGQPLQPDVAAGDELWRAVRADQLGSWATSNSQYVVPDPVP